MFKLASRTLLGLLALEVAGVSAGAVRNEPRQGGTATLTGPTIFTPTPSPTRTIPTPRPVQDGIVANCDEFYRVESGDRCDVILPRLGLTMEQAYAWNPAIGPDCRGLWAGTYICVSIVGHESKPSNGIPTPRPVIPGIAADCDKFYKIKRADRCEYIVEDYGLTMDIFIRWNPQVGAKCDNFWEDFYICVGTIGYVPPVPTTPPNGVPTPRPVQPGMTKKCKSFHYVNEGQTCDYVAALYHVSVSDFISWNTGVGPRCADMWSYTYVCVAVL